MLYGSVISMDFTVDLLKLHGHTQIYVIVDCFTRMTHLIPLKDDPKWSNDLDKIFVSNIWHVLGLLSDIVSDQDRWCYALLAEVCELFDIRRRMSTAYDPKNDGQSELGIQTLDWYHCAFFNFEQDDWNEMLLMAIYAYNHFVT
jgi:hypothetical protein